MTFKEFTKIAFCNILLFAGVSRFLRHRYRKRLLVVTYHGVTQSKNPPSAWTLLPARIFEQQISWLAKYYNPVSLNEVLSAAATDNPLPDHSVLITLDDGFRNNMTVAYPILKRYRIPTVIFLTVDYINSDRFFWVDELLLTILEAGKQQANLRLTNPQANFLFSKKQYYEAYHMEVEYLKRKHGNERSALLQQVVSQVGFDRSTYIDDFGMLTWPEVFKMDKEGLIEFGSHTATHRILTNTPEELLEGELAGSKIRLEKKLGHEIRAFCYPNGQFGKDYSPEHRKLLAHYGYKCAFATDYGLYNPGKDHPLSIPRVGVGNDISARKSFYRLSMSGFFEYRKSFLSW